MQFHKIAKFKFTPIKPYNFQLTVKKPAGWSWFTPYEKWEKGTIWSGSWFELSDRKHKAPLGIKAFSKNNTVTVEIFASQKLSKQDINLLKDHMSQSLGITEDLRPFYKLMKKNRFLKDVALHLYGMKEGWGMNIFSSLTLAVLLQMAPIKRSEEMWHCLIQKHGKRIKFDGKSILLWPNENTIAKQSPHRLAVECKLGYRSKFLVKLAKQLVAGFPSIDDLAKMTPEAANDKLMELFGVGEYTAGFANPHPSFILDVWSIKIFYPIIFGRHAPSKDPRSGIMKASVAAEKMWGPWRSYVLAYVLNDLPYLSKKFKIPVV